MVTCIASSGRYRSPFVLFMHAAVVLDMALQLQRFQGNEAPFPAHLCGVGPYAQPSLRKVARGS